MIDEEKIYRLVGWLRPVREDCLGIPLFTDGSNTEFLPETDNRLRITAFHACYNDEGYLIERCLPVGASQVAYIIGAGVPIPFAKGNLTVIASSEEDASTFLKGQKEDSGHPVVKAVRKILEKSESGAFERNSVLRNKLEFKDRHATILLEDPVHSRYWVEQFKRAALDIRTLAPAARPFASAQLQLVANRWIGRFRTSGDPALLFAVIQEVDRYGLGQPGFAKGIYYDVARHLLAIGNYKYLLNPLLVEQMQKAIPEGIYYYEVNSSQRKKNVPLDNVNLLLHMITIIRDGEDKLDFRPALVAANMMFGREALHPDIYALVARTASQMVDLIEQGIKSYSGRPMNSLANDLVKMYYALITLRQMMDWTERSDATVVALGLSQTAIFLIKQWLQARHG